MRDEFEWIFLLFELIDDLVRNKSSSGILPWVIRLSFPLKWVWKDKNGDSFLFNEVTRIYTL
jgi:hypothetical protein